MSDSERNRPGAKSPEDRLEDTVVEILGFDNDDDSNGDDGSGVGGERDGRSAALEAEIDEQKERYVRLRADFDNFRKRTERERGEIERYALVEPVRELLPVVDNLERALTSAAQQGGGDDLKQGVEMVLRQLQEVLRRFGLTVVPALGERFDPSLHEAVAHQSSNDVEAPTVVDEFQRGYRLNDRLLRPAMVRVAMPADSAATVEGGNLSAASSAERSGEPNSGPPEEN